MNDKGQGGITGTLSAWDNRSGILTVAGVNKSADDQTKVNYFTVKGVRFAFLAYTAASLNKLTAAHDVNVYNDDLALAQVKEAHQQANFVIVSMYWGNDGSADVTPDQEATAQKLATAGADVILGVGTHVLQTSKVLDGTDKHQTLVWYGLGNSLNTQLSAENLVGGIAIMDIDAATRKITNPAFLSTYMGYEWSAAQAKAQTLNARTNLKLYALDQATDAITKSQLKTSVQAQTERVTTLMTKFIPIRVITSADY
jgi:poly-gamma-glutamate capsule biosynthesis protein CapA/YwtB (metallophosphatase superfamily)